MEFNGRYVIWDCHHKQGYRCLKGALTHYNKACINFDETYAEQVSNSI